MGASEIEHEQQPESQLSEEASDQSGIAVSDDLSEAIAQPMVSGNLLQDDEMANILFE